jgi:hypothetical protein
LRRLQLNFDQPVQRVLAFNPAQWNTVVGGVDFPATSTTQPTASIIRLLHGVGAPTSDPEGLTYTAPPNYIIATGDAQPFQSVLNFPITV